MRLGIRGLAAVLALVAGALLLPAAAWPVPPANDAFANREVLSGALPIEVTRSNLDATKEDGELIPRLSPAGHSVWFEWEAQSTGWTTIGACDDEFPLLVEVFTGTELEHLTPVVSRNQDEGPDCPNVQRQYTFKATSGSRYVIAVDGNGFFVDPPPPTTEGEFSLRIEATPPPPNDDFANAEPLQGEISEEPGGSRFYFAHAQGYNWGGTTETGELSDGTSDGATVWYTWTAPEAAEYLFGGPCCGVGFSWSLYTGDSFAGLSQILIGAMGGAEVSAVAGSTYRIAVYGTPDSGTGEPTMGSFQLNISAALPPLPSPPPHKDSPVAPAPGPNIPPETALIRSAIFAVSRSARFWFVSSEPAGFLCRLDRQPYKACSSPMRFERLKPGRHTFRVKAIDAAGNADLTPAVTHFKLPHPKRRYR